MYHSIDGSIVAARGTDDYINTVVSGATAGALFKSTAGVRAAGIVGRERESSCDTDVLLAL